MRERLTRLEDTVLRPKQQAETRAALRATALQSFDSLHKLEGSEPPTNHSRTTPHANTTSKSEVADPAEDVNND